MNKNTLKLIYYALVYHILFMVTYFGEIHTKNEFQNLLLFKKDCTSNDI